MLKMILSLFFLLGGILKAQVYDLERIKLEAHKNNYILHAVRSEQEFYKEKEWENKARFLPKIGLKAGWEKTKAKDFKENERTRSVYSEINLFNGFKDLREVQIGKLDSKAASSRLEATNWKINLKLEELFYKYLFLLHKDEVLEKQIERHQIHLSLIKKRLSSSLVTKTDLLAFELEKSKLDSRHEFLEIEIKETKHLLLKMAGIQSPQAELKGELPHYSLLEELNDLLHSFKKSSLSIAESQIHLEQGQLEVSQTNGGWLPRIDLSVEYGRLSEKETGITSEKETSAIGIVAKWELFSGFSTSSEKGKKRAHKLKEEYLHKQKILETEALIRSHYQILKALEKRLIAEEKNLAMAETLYKRTKGEFRRGVKDSGDLAGASTQLAEIAEGVFELKKNYIDSKITLEEALSRPLKLSKIEHK